MQKPALAAKIIARNQAGWLVSLIGYILPHDRCCNYSAAIIVRHISQLRNFHPKYNKRMSQIWGVSNQNNPLLFTLSKYWFLYRNSSYTISSVTCEAIVMCDLVIVYCCHLFLQKLYMKNHGADFCMGTTAHVCELEFKSFRKVSCLILVELSSSVPFLFL